MIFILSSESKSVRVFGRVCSVLIFLFCFSGPVLAQKELKTAEAHYAKFEYTLAVEAYKKALAKKKSSPEITARIAECYRLLNNTKEAETWYAQLVELPNPKPEYLKQYADVARQNGNYLVAKQQYLTYAEEVPETETETLKLITTCENAQAWMAQPESYKVTQPAGLNSGKGDFSPIYYQEGLVFTSDRPLAVAAKTGKKQVSGWTGNPYTKLVYAKGDSTQWAAPEALPAPLNSDFQTGSAVFSANQNVVFFTRINKIKSKNKKINTDPFSWVKFSAAADYTNRLEIFMSEKKGDKWTEPTPFAYNKVADYSVGHPALSPDGTTLYFVSDMPGSLGQTDIFYAQREVSGSWGTPINAGNEINTPGKEMFPTIGADGTLYFSSDGHPGMGGLDIFAATGSAADWKNIRNLKYPLNSSQDDFGIIFDKTGEAGYLSSNRESTDGTDDILAFKYVRVPCRLAGRTVERRQTKPGSFKETPVSKVQLRLYKEGDTTATITYSDATGNFTFPILDGIKYTIKGAKEGYLNSSASITPDCQSVIDMVNLGMILNRNTPNKPIVLENIYYDTDKHYIRPDAALELDKLVQTLKDNPGIKIELSSHTDSRQTHSYNNLLSQLRAEAAVNYITSQGIGRMRMTAKGYGETQLRNRCADKVNCPEEEHQLNRRTEFKILKVK